MHKSLDEIKNTLNKEIDIAERNLNENLKNISVLGYLKNSKNSLPHITNELINNPVTVLENLDSISSIALPKKHVIRKSLMFLSFIIRGSKLLSRPNPS
jgi:hypothetical protein